MGSLDKSSHLFEGLNFLLLLLYGGFLTQEFAQDYLLGKFCNLEKQGMFMALPGVILADDIVHAIYLVLCRILPLLQGLHCLVDYIAS